MDSDSPAQKTDARVNGLRFITFLLVQCSRISKFIVVTDISSQTIHQWARTID